MNSNLVNKNQPENFNLFLKGSSMALMRNFYLVAVLLLFIRKRNLSKVNKLVIL